MLYVWCLYICSYFFGLTFAAIIYGDKVKLYEEPDIKYFTELLEESLNKKLLNYTFSPLTTSNDHYGATLHRVDIQLAKTNASDDVRKE